MNPTEFNGQNAVLRGNGKDVGDLNVHMVFHVGHTVVSSAWKPTAEELQGLIDGGSVYISIYTQNGAYPPIAVNVIKGE